jgi:hypothetical protein
MKSFLKQIEESFQSLDEKKERWQDNDGDGIWYEPGVDVKEDIENLGKYKPKKYDRDGDGVPNGADSDPDDGDVNEELNEDEIEEASTSAGAGAYMTPRAFGKADDDIVEVLGYKRVQEAMDNKYERLIEGYKTFALSDPKMSPAKKVNASIKNVAKQLKEIEETIKYTSRLKTESGISHSGFGPSTSKALGKISERLIKISERVRSLGE